MATYHKYKNGQGYYIRHTFKLRQKLTHVTYQVSEEGRKVLESKSYCDGDSIPKALVLELERDGLIFTNHSGAEGQEYPYTEIGPLDDLDISHLTEETKLWVVRRMVCHPKVSATIEWIESADGNTTPTITLDNAPRNFMEQLIRAARLLDGTDFFNNLDKSYNYDDPNKSSEAD